MCMSVQASMQSLSSQLPSSGCLQPRGQGGKLYRRRAAAHGKLYRRRAAAVKEPRKLEEGEEEGKEESCLRAKILVKEGPSTLCVK
jgi:phage terminase Nu1 subunit (DNA packaging protein)